MRSENGLCFIGEAFKLLIRERMIIRSTSSPHHPVTNGLAKRAVQIVKKLWMNKKDKYLALLIYRNTPLESGVCSSQLMLGKVVCSQIPASDRRVDLHNFRWMRD